MAAEVRGTNLKYAIQTFFELRVLNATSKIM
jgi:hypothetical protein